MVEYFAGKSVLVTGASAGIGEELARQFARAGATLTLTARRGTLLNSLADEIAASGAPRPIVVEGDVTHDGDMARAVAAATRQWHRLDVVIANAGFGVVGALRDLSVDDYRRQFETNLFGVLRTLHAALPEIEQARGHVVIIGSVAGWVSSPGSSPYSMSKFALRALADAIGPELRPLGVKVTLISPGFVDSSIRQVDNQGVFQPTFKDPVPRWLSMRTDRAVRQMLKAIANGKREAIVTGHGKILVALQRFAPWTLRAAARRMKNHRYIATSADR